jgi:LysM repeat protein
MIKLNNLNAVIPSNILVKYYTENDAAYQQLNKMLDAIEGEKNLTADIVYNIIPNIKGTGAFDEKYFNTLTEDQQKVYTTTIASIVNIPEPQIIASEDYQNWLKENTTIEGRQYGGAQYPKGTSQAALLAYYKEQQGFKAVTEGASITALAPTTPSTGGNKKGPDASPLDDLLKKLRDVRKNTIKVTKGFDASFKSLNKIFGGKKTIEVFSGIENDMRRLGAGEDLIDLIVGMDPAEFEKQKNKLFKFKNGEIVALKDGAKSIGDALQSIALGDFVSTQDRMVKNIGNQNVALERLQAAGVEGSIALDMVADSGTAAAIANSKLSDKQLKKVIKAAKEATKAQKQMAATESITKKISEVKEEGKAYTNLIKIMGQFTREEIALIIDSAEAMGQLALGFDAPGSLANFKTLLDSLKKEAENKFKIKLLTIEGMQEIFDTGFSNAMESFDVKETALRLRFNIDNKALNDEIKKAEEKIALAQEKIRIEEVGLKQIEDQEEKVNEQYDKRLEALDEVEKANASISQQQKGQLTLAEALTSGDIAAAARAAQEMRAQQAADAVTKQKEALEQSREYELSQLRSEDGRSRIEIETKIKELQDQIYEIETKSLEPNRETLRLNELALENAIAGLTTLGKTREQWEAIKNAVDLARISSAQFIKSMQDALNIQGSLIKAYQEQKVNTPVITPEQKVTCPEGYEFDGTNCVMKGATVIVCPAGFKQVGDKCVKEGTTEIICPDGHTLVGNNCVKEAEKKTVCPEGYNLVGNDCVKVGPTKTVCPDGYDLVGNDCIKQGNKVDDPIIPATTATTTPTTTKYVVQPGDTLWDIAKDNNMSLSELYKLNPKFKTDPKYNGGNMIWSGTTVKLPTTQNEPGGGGLGHMFMSNGGLINPMRFAVGGFAKGTDTVPAMLTPGEFVMSKYAVDSYGIDNMKKINNGESVGGSVYNNTYALTVNARTDANPNDIAQAVMATIKQVDDRRIRGVAISGRR